MNKEEIEHIRADFPILNEKIYNKDLIYFDNAATTQKPRCVVEKIEYAYFHLNANIHRGVHYLSLKATEAHEAARLIAAKFLHAEKKKNIVLREGQQKSIYW
jgi:cysteine desulfurase/selenocysteine lyase